MVTICCLGRKGERCHLLLIEGKDDEGHFFDDSSTTTVSLRSSSLKSTQLKKRPW
uniref:Uncharacterized protein n=1 Tax=Helianthus annuus TaxID=4232 RepID=A0A251TN24_HELAN